MSCLLIRYHTDWGQIQFLG